MTIGHADPRTTVRPCTAQSGQASDVRVGGVVKSKPYPSPITEDDGSITFSDDRVVIGLGVVARRPRPQEFLGYETPASEVKHSAELPEPQPSALYASITPVLPMKSDPEVSALVYTVR